MVTDPLTNTLTNKPTDRTDYNTLRRSYLARSVIKGDWLTLAEVCALLSALLFIYDITGIALIVNVSGAVGWRGRRQSMRKTQRRQPQQPMSSNPLDLTVRDYDVDLSSPSSCQTQRQPSLTQSAVLQSHAAAGHHVQQLRLRSYWFDATRSPAAKPGRRQKSVEDQDGCSDCGGAETSSEFRRRQAAELCRRHPTAVNSCWTQHRADQGPFSTIS